MYYLIVVLIFCGTSVPTFLVGKLTEAGWTDAQSWRMAAVVAGVIVLVSVGMMWRATKGHNPINDQALAEKFSVRIICDSVSVLHLPDSVYYKTGNKPR